MSRFKFRLQALLKYRTHQRDLCRQLLAQVMHDYQQLQRQRDELELNQTQLQHQIRQTSGVGTVDVQAISNRRFYAGQLKIEDATLRQKQQLVQQQIDMCREALVKADQAVKALEKLETTKRAEFTARQLRQEDREREEIWFGTHHTGGLP